MLAFPGQWERPVKCRILWIFVLPRTTNNKIVLEQEFRINLVELEVA